MGTELRAALDIQEAVLGRGGAEGRGRAALAMELTVMRMEASANEVMEREAHAKPVGY